MQTGVHSIILIFQYVKFVLTTNLISSKRIEAGPIINFEALSDKWARVISFTSFLVWCATQLCSGFRWGLLLKELKDLVKPKGGRQHSPLKAPLGYSTEVWNLTWKLYNKNVRKMTEKQNITIIHIYFKR